MAARGDFRHNAAVDRVEVRLGKNLIGQDLPSVLDHGHGRLIAGGFKCKDLHRLPLYYMY